MAEPDKTEKKCSCGSVMKVAAIVLGQRYTCPTCQAESLERTTYEVDGDLQGQDPLVYLVRRRVASDETRDVPIAALVGATAPTQARRPSERAAPQPPSDEAPTDAPELGAPVSDSSKLGMGILAPNARLGNYRILETLGQGGMGVVYKAHDTSLDRHVALKVLSRELTANKQFIERFVREARAAAQLTHPNITSIFFCGSEGRTHYYVMEFVEGRNLADLVKERPLQVSRALDVARQCTLGLKAATDHRIIHRDVKPSNILLMPDGQVKITDFGLAKAVIGTALELTSTGVVMGTPIYMSPEQGRGANIDHRSDIYSLGATLYHVLVGKPPFEADSPIALILKHINEPVAWPQDPFVPEGVKNLIVRMLEKDPDRRFPTHDALLEAIDRVARGDEPMPSRDEPSRRLVVLRHRRERTAKRSLFKVGKLSVARTNLKLGRRDKAVSLLRETLDEAGDPALKGEAALLLLEIFEKENDQDGVRRMAELVVDAGGDAASVAYACWKLAVMDERQALAKERSALALYERILRDPPEGLPRALIEAQIRRLRARVESSEREMGATQVVLGDEEGAA
ncbi:MAG TPA: serine/threonine-protein kinase [Planctomycetota bacterium]|nr:serine/threonine-protein kinase [Planctomycetota bacterium]